jgi:DNA-binding transcriptional MerR regulator
MSNTPRTPTTLLPTPSSVSPLASDADESDADESDADASDTDESDADESLEEFSQFIRDNHPVVVNKPDGSESSGTKALLIFGLVHVFRVYLGRELIKRLIELCYHHEDVGIRVIALLSDEEVSITQVLEFLDNHEELKEQLMAHINNHEELKKQVIRLLHKMENLIQEQGISTGNIFFPHEEAEEFIDRETILEWLGTGFMYEDGQQSPFPELYAAYLQRTETDNKPAFLTRCANAGINTLYLAGIEDNTNLWDEAIQWGKKIESNFVDETHPNLRSGTDERRFDCVVLSYSTSFLGDDEARVFPEFLIFPEGHRLLLDDDYSLSSFDPVANAEQIAQFATTDEKSAQLDNQSDPDNLSNITYSDTSSLKTDSTPRTESGTPRSDTDALRINVPRRRRGGSTPQIRTPSLFGTPRTPQIETPPFDGSTPPRVWTPLLSFGPGTTPRTPRTPQNEPPPLSGGTPPRLWTPLLNFGLGASSIGTPRTPRTPSTAHGEYSPSSSPSSR